MRQTRPQSDNPKPLNGSVRVANASWRNSTKNALSMLIGWQTLPALIIVLYLLVGIFGPTLAPFDPNRGTISDRLCPPLAIDALTIAQHPASRSTECSAANVLGTDHNGRDIFSRLLHGARTSLSVVGPSVVLGTTLGTLVCAVINGWRTKARLIAYLITSVTIVPFSIFLISEPYSLYIFGVTHSGAGGGNDEAWSVFVALSSAAAVITLAVVAIAYRYDDTCRSAWSTNVDADFPIHSFCRRLYAQIVNLAPWIVFAAIASAALVFLRSGTTFVQNAAISWRYEPDYLFEHIGMLGPFVPMVLIPIAFVSLAAWWLVNQILGRFNSTSINTPSAGCNVDVTSEEPLRNNSVQTEENPTHVESQTDENEGAGTSINADPSADKQRWLLTIVAIVAAFLVIRFGAAEALPIVRELTQDPADGYESTWSQSVQGRGEAINCANELSSRLMTLRSLPPEELEIESSQRCLDLYYQHRNAPSHRWTIDYALQFVPQTLTVALIGAIVSAALWNAVAASSHPIRLVVGICVLLVTLIGMTMTFGYAAWSLAVLQWFNPVDLVVHDTGIAISRALNLIRDFTVALGISYFTIAIAEPTFRFGKPLPKFGVLTYWAAFFVPCVFLTAALLILFHYRFPVHLLFIDDVLGVILDPKPEHTYISSGSLIRNGLWTYWFAAIGYAAIVFAFFYAAVSGFSRYAIDEPSSDEIKAPVSPDSPSPGADPT